MQCHERYYATPRRETLNITRDAARVARYQWRPAARSMPPGARRCRAHGQATCRGDADRDARMLRDTRARLRDDISRSRKQRQRPLDTRMPMRGHCLPTTPPNAAFQCSLAYINRAGYFRAGCRTMPSSQNGHSAEALTSSPTVRAATQLSRNAAMDASAGLSRTDDAHAPFSHF